MKLIKAYISVLVALFLLFSITGIFPTQPQKVQADTTVVFSDINGHWGYATIMWAAELGIVKGVGDGTFGPNRYVTEAEFLTMLFNAFPETPLTVPGTGPWYAKYYETAASSLKWPVTIDSASKPVLRGQVARIVVASQGKLLSTDQAIHFLLDQKLANGKTSATVDGFGKEAPLTRAEAVSFIKNLLDHDITAIIKAEGAPVKEEKKDKENEIIRTDREFVIRGIALGDTESDLLKTLDQPARKDLSEYGFLWYVYNQNYANYIQVGVSQGKVVALYSNASSWKSGKGIKVGSTMEETEKQYGDSITNILKGNTMYSIMRQNNELDVFLIDQAYTTIFYDNYVNDTVTAVLQIAKETELSLHGYAGKPSAELSKAFELQDFDLVNAVRVRMGHPAFQWADDAAASARKHSEDMGENDLFDHTNLLGKSPFDRMKAAGVSYSSAGENIAAGQQSAIYAHEGWMNSKGHRSNILTDFTRLGVGVGFGDSMNTYYTENFYTPRK